MLKISIRAARVNAGLTQVEAADLLGVSEGTLVKWESRPELIPAYRQRAISETYQIPIDNLIFLPNVKYEANKQHKKNELE
jgi:transcriptional regulator with XRE-family HTH domain